MSIKEEKEIIGKLLDQLHTAIVLALAQKAALLTFAPEEVWAASVLKAEKMFSEGLREAFAQLRETILAQRPEAPSPHDIDQIVRKLIESASDIDPSGAQA